MLGRTGEVEVEGRKKGIKLLLQWTSITGEVANYF